MFKLNIECTKDISELSISFADGTSVVKTTKDISPRAKTKSSKQNKHTKQDQFIDTDSDFGNISQEIIKPPEIQREQTSVNVAEELQNLDI